MISVVLLCVKTDLGEFRGLWMSNSTPQKAKYYIELECDPITNYRQIELSTEEGALIYDYGNYLRINGFVEDCDDNVITLRLSDSLMMIETAHNINCLQYLHHWIIINIPSIKIYDEG